jgi:MFS family permease
MAAALCGDLLCSAEGARRVACNIISAWLGRAPTPGEWRRVAPRDGGAFAKPVAALALTQVIGWGSTYYLPAVFAAGMSAGTGLPTEFVFGGVTLMLLIAGFVAPASGRALERYGARPCLVIGSGLIALGLVLLAFAHGPALFALAWVVIGVATPFGLSQGASTALVQLAPDRARRAITILFLLSGMSSTASWPTLIWLEGSLGWRGAVLLCAAIHACVCLPVHLFVLRPKPKPEPVLDAEARVDAAGPAASDAPLPIRGGFALAAVGLSLSGFITWGLPLHLIFVLRDFGHPEVAAVAIGALLGPAQMSSRFVEMMGGHRLDILVVGVLAIGLMPVSLLVLLAAGTSPTGAVAFTFLYGFSAGLISVVRAVTPLRLFGRAAYATALGRLALPQNIAFAASPMALAAVRQEFGTVALVVVVIAAALVSLLAMAILAGRARATNA